MPSHKTMRKKNLAKTHTRKGVRKHPRKHTRKHTRKTGGGFKLSPPGPKASAEEKAQFRKGIMRLYADMNFTIPSMAHSKRQIGLNALALDEWSKYFLKFMIPLIFNVDNAPSKYTFINEFDYADAWDELCESPHITMKTIEDNINLPWNWNAIITNPNFTVAFYEKHLDKPWNWESVVTHPDLKYIDLGFLEKYKNADWNWKALSGLSNLTMDFVERNMEGIPWDWDAIARHRNLTMDFVERHSEINWNWRIMSSNPALTIDFIERHPEIRWDWHEISKNPNITAEFIEKNMDKVWNWFQLSANPAITLDYIKKAPKETHLLRRYVQGYLDYNWLSQNPNITMEFVQQHITEDWNWRWLSQNPSLTMEFVEQNMDRDWDWVEMSTNPSLTMKFVEKHLDLDWNWRRLSKNPSITMDFAERHLDKIMLYDFFTNPSITMKFIKKLLAKPEVNERINVYLVQIVSNTFSAEKALFFQYNHEAARKYVLTTRLQKAVRERMFDNPEYKSARERQMKQFEETETPSEMTEAVKGYIANIKQLVDYQKIPPELREFLVKK